MSSSTRTDADTFTIASAFLPLPNAATARLCVLGPKPEEAGAAIEPLAKLDEPLGVVQFYLAGLCSREGALLAPLEVALVLDSANVAPCDAPPPADVVRALREVAAAGRPVPETGGFDVLRNVASDMPPFGPLLYCRKRHALFEARSPNEAKRLRAAPPAAESAEPASLPAELVLTDGGGATYGARGGDSTVGPAAALEQLLLDQGRVVAYAAELEGADPVAFARLAGGHVCCTCPERERCYPANGGYAFSLDRLVLVNTAEAAATATPVGEWDLHEAAQILGGRLPSEIAAGHSDWPDDWRTFRAGRARAYETHGPPLLLTGEGDGREVLEIVRLKVALLTEALAQLEAAWRAFGRPHLAWRDHTVRVAWRAPTTTPAAAWGLQPLLRCAGLTPFAPFESHEGGPLSYPPTYSSPALLPPTVVEAARYFGVEQRGGLFVKTAKPAGGRDHAVRMLIEDLPVERGLFVPGDALHVTDGKWEGVFTPARDPDPNDGAGLTVVGKAAGNVEGLKPDAQIGGATVRWYPRFGEAVDLHALGVLALRTLLAHDDRPPAALARTLTDELRELERVCLSVPIAQREGKAREWLRGRSENDAPAAVWSRRNALATRAARASTRLDALPLHVWQAVLSCLLRLTTQVAGFSYCADRTQSAPRLADGQLFPLVELRGLVAILDDLLLTRRAPGEAAKKALGAR